MTIKDAGLKVIFDSRGEKTLEAFIISSDDYMSSASVPSGKSKGSHEKISIDPDAAVLNFEKIKKETINKKDFSSQKSFDYFLLEIDGTKDKSNLGENVCLALSLAFARLSAQLLKTPLFSYINLIFKSEFSSNASISIPRPIFNVINGGAHANNPLSFQEFQVIPSVNDFSVGFAVGCEFYRKLRIKLEEVFGKENVVLGDEAGFSCPFKDNDEALEIIYELIRDNSHPLSIGLDCAASQYFKDESYVVDGNKYNKDELLELYIKLIERYGIISIEDPFFEEDFGSFASLYLRINKSKGEDFKLITDDLTTTDKERLGMAIKEKSGNTILIKPNQIGTLSETLEVVSFAYQNNWKVVVSHRSGETNDDFIADLAVGVGAWGLKSGAPGKPERLAKYNRICDILRYMEKGR